MTEHRVATDRTGADVASADIPPEEPAVDVAVIDQLASITDSQGLSVLSELLHAFLAAVPIRLDALDRAVLSGDLTTMADQAHALTGSSASFGAKGMAALCRQLRTAAEHHDLDLSRGLVRALHDEYQRVRASLMSLITGAA